jgi:hypothetical protein
MAVTVEIKGSNPCIEIDLEKPTLSASGKTLVVASTSRSLKNYCGTNLRCCHSLKTSTYKGVRLGFLLAYAWHIGLLMTFFNNMLGGMRCPR